MHPLLRSAAERQHGVFTAADARRARYAPLETRGRLRIVGSGLPAPELQVAFRTDGRLVGVVDAWFDDAAVAVEFGGRVTYTDPWRKPGRALWEEKRREDDLRSLDLAVVRIADADLGARWAPAEERLRQLIARSGPPRRRFTSTPRRRGLPRTGWASSGTAAERAPHPPRRPRRARHYPRVAPRRARYRATQCGQRCPHAIRLPAPDRHRRRAHHTQPRRPVRSAGVDRRRQAYGRGKR